MSLSTALCLAGAISIGAFVALHVAYDRGEAAERARNVIVQQKADKAADAQLYALNARVSDLQSVLDIKIGVIADQQKEIDHAKTDSAALQQQLADGSRRLSVLVHVAASQAAAAQGAQGAAAGAVDPAGAISASLDGRAASDLEWLRQTRNDALQGLAGCLSSYDAVKAAADGVQP